MYYKPREDIMKIIAEESEAIGLTAEEGHEVWKYYWRVHILNKLRDGYFCGINIGGMGRFTNSVKDMEQFLFGSYRAVDLPGKRDLTKLRDIIKELKIRNMGIIKKEY